MNLKVKGCIHIYSDTELHFTSNYLQANMYAITYAVYSTYVHSHAYVLYVVTYDI